MRRSHVICSIGGLAALLAAVAVCQAYPPEPATTNKVTPTVPANAAPPLPGCALVCPASAAKADAAPDCCKTKCCASEAKACAPGCCPTAPAAPPGASAVFKDAKGHVFVTGAAGFAPCQQPGCGGENVYTLLAKLEALKGKQEALDAEVRETYALLNEKFRTLQIRMAKAGAGVPTPVTYGVPAYPVASPVYAPAPAFDLPVVTPSAPPAVTPAPAADAPTRPIRPTSSLLPPSVDEDAPPSDKPVPPGAGVKK